MNLPQQLEQRFLRYVAIDSQSAFNATCVPSTTGQMTLANLLCDELKALGINNASVNDHAILTAKISANTHAPSIGFLAHLDTVDVGLSSEIKAQKIHYTGQDIVLNEALDLHFDKQMHPEIDRYLNDDIFVSDGTSVLGADDKAAIAVIMTLAQYLTDNPEVPHGDVHIAFVPDEEIGLAGAKLLDLNVFNPDYAYTVDCCEMGEVVYETFNAAQAKVALTGVTAHPMSAKGVLVNPVLICNHIINQFDTQQTPECTEGREGYTWFTNLDVNPSQAKITINIRDHDLAKFEAKKTQIQHVIAQTQAKYPTSKIELVIEDTYANIANSADKNHPAVNAIYEAFEQLGIEAKTIAMRGGTDGSALSAKGLVTPNFFTGAHNFHSKFEFLPMSSFVKSYQVAQTLVLNAAKSS